MTTIQVLNGLCKMRFAVPDIPAYGEGETENEAIDDLKEALRGYVEAFGLDDALSRLTQPALRTIDFDLAELARG